MGDLLPWPKRTRALVEAARELVQAADEHPPEHVPPGEWWPAGHALIGLVERARTYTPGPAPSIFCRACGFRVPGPLLTGPAAPAIYCPECRALLMQAVQRCDP